MNATFIWLNTSVATIIIAPYTPRHQRFYSWNETAIVNRKFYNVGTNVGFKIPSCCQPRLAQTYTSHHCFPFFQMPCSRNPSLLPLSLMLNPSQPRTPISPASPLYFQWNSQIWSSFLCSKRKSPSLTEHNIVHPNLWRYLTRTKFYHLVSAAPWYDILSKHMASIKWNFGLHYWTN